MKKPFHEYCIEISERADTFRESRTLLPECARRLARAIDFIQALNVEYFGLAQAKRLIHELKATLEKEE